MLLVVFLDQDCSTWFDPIPYMRMPMIHLLHLLSPLDKKTIRPKKKMFVCPFLTDPKNWKTRVCFFFWYSTLYFSTKMSKYVVTVPKRNFNQIYWNTTTSNTRIKLILRLCMPKNAHTHEWYCISSASRFKKKKNQPTDPLNFQAKRANKPFIF